MRRSPSWPQRQADLLDALRRQVEANDDLRWLELGCSLATGRGDELSDVDAAIGHGYEVDDLRQRTRELVTAVGPAVDVLIHAEQGWPSGIVRAAVEYESDVQLDLVMMPADHREGLPPDSLALVDKDGHLSSHWEPPVRSADGEEVREWTMLGWWALSDCAKYLRRGSTFEAYEALARARTQLYRLFAVVRQIPYPGFGLTSLLDYEPYDVPSGVEATYAGPHDSEGLLRAAFALAGLLSATEGEAASVMTVDLDTAWEHTARRRLDAVR